MLIIADDLGYGDLGCYGARRIPTPNIDRLAQNGRIFRNGYAPSATCTPSRYSILTGEYAWRQSKKKTAILAGDDPLCIPRGRTTLPSLLQQAGYTTAVIGKWHLGLGDGTHTVDFNESISPGPREIGFQESFIIPATLDRVPTVFIENQRVLNLDPSDPIRVSYQAPIGNEPTGVNSPGMLRQKADLQHSGTIVNGISRIGWMSGGKSARWVDEDIAGQLAARADRFIAAHTTKPFFLYFASHEPHVPRLPNARFHGATGLGPRGDAIAEFDWTVGEVLASLERAGVADNTLVLLSSDNGPVLFDGYMDDAAERNGDHRPAGGLRGWKYGVYEGGTRVPFIVRWPGHVPAGSFDDRIICLTDLLATFSALAGRQLAEGDGRDSLNQLPVLQGKTAASIRTELVLQGAATSYSLRINEWKFVPASREHEVNKVAEAFRDVDIRHIDAYRGEEALYNLTADPAETRNVAREYPARTAEMRARLALLTTLP